MHEAGIWDSLKVIQTYLKDSVSIASLVTSVECIAVRKKEYTRNIILFNSNTIEKVEEPKRCLLKIKLSAYPKC